MTDLENITLVIPSPIEPSALLGSQDEFLHLIEDSTAARISLHDKLRIQGNALEVQSLTTLFAGLIKTLEAGEALTADEVKRSLNLMRAGELAPPPMKKRIDLFLIAVGRFVLKHPRRNNTWMPSERTRSRLALVQRVLAKHTLLWLWR